MCLELRVFHVAEYESQSTCRGTVRKRTRGWGERDAAGEDAGSANLCLSSACLSAPLLERARPAAHPIGIRSGAIQSANFGVRVGRVSVQPSASLPELYRKITAAVCRPLPYQQCLEPHQFRTPKRAPRIQRTLVVLHCRQSQSSPLQFPNVPRLSSVALKEREIRLPRIRRNSVRDSLFPRSSAPRQGMLRASKSNNCFFL